MKLFDFDSWEEIWQTIRRNRMRSIMTALGVFWGIFMLVVLAGGGMGLERKLHQNVGGLASNTAFFYTDRTSIPYKGMRSGRYWEFTNSDGEAILKEVKGAKFISASIQKWGLDFSYKDRKGNYNLIGLMPQYQLMNPQKINYGRFINEIDMIQHRKVCVISNQIYKELFPGGGNPIGSQIRTIGGVFTVVGVYTVQRGMGLWGEKTVIIPLTTIQRMFGMGEEVHSLAVTGFDDVPIKRLEEDVKTLIRSRHLISPDDNKAIGAYNMSEEFQIFSNLFLGIGLLTWIVGLGTLLAGIVGVSNIMLVVVRERTQEIGVRRAIGAPPRAIIMQIMSESFVLTFVAGVMGLFFGIGLMSIVDTALNASVVADGGIPTSWQISFGAALISAGVLMLGGILAGIIPAVRAIRIKPVDAIREE